MTALKDDKGNRISYDELGAEGERFYRAVGACTLMFLLCENSIGAVTGYTACLRHRVVPVLLSAHLEKTLFDRLLATYEPAPDNPRDVVTTEISISDILAELDLMEQGITD